MMNIFVCIYISISLYRWIFTTLKWLCYRGVDILNEETVQEKSSDVGRGSEYIDLKQNLRPSRCPYNEADLRESSSRFGLLFAQDSKTRMCPKQS